MSHTWRFSLIIGLSIVFGAPVLGEMALRPDDLVIAGLRYLAALGLSWVGVSFIYRLVDGYAIHNRILEEKVAAEAARADAMARAAAEALEAAEAADAAQLTTEPAMS